MEDVGRRKSRVRLLLELVEESVMLILLELKLAAVEIHRNIRSAEKGAVMMAVGSCLLLFALLTLIGTAVAALAIILPVWLSALVVTLVLACFGAAFFFAGLGSLRHFSLVPSETLHRIQDISNQLKKAGVPRQGAGGSAEPERAPGHPLADSAPHKKSEFK